MHTFIPAASFSKSCSKLGIPPPERGRSTAERSEAVGWGSLRTELNTKFDPPPPPPRPGPGPRPPPCPLWARVLGFVALVFAWVNISGGFLVTQRMLGMYRTKGRAGAGDEH